MLRQSTRKRAPAGFVKEGDHMEIKEEEHLEIKVEEHMEVKVEEHMEVKEETWVMSPSQTQNSSDEGPSTTSCCGTDSASQTPQLQAWKTETEPDTVIPCPPKFIPRRTPGIQRPLTMGTQAPEDIFGLFFDREMLNLICENTNKYAAKKRETEKRVVRSDLTPQELTKYLGMLLYMSVCSLPKMTDYWRKKSIFHVSFPATVMSRDRFLAITSNLCLSSPEEDAANEQRKGTEEHDPLQRVRCALDMMRNRCKAMYHPRQHISVDERIIATKARLKIKQHMPAKPTKWGLKCFVLADVNGYTVDYKLYAGKNQGASGKGLSFDVVAELVNKDYLGSGYIVYCDMFYTSPLLFRHLTQQGFGVCGTYRQGRVGVPTTVENALDKKSKRGSIRWIRDGDLLYVKWMDTREISMCTTVHPVYTGETVLRWQKTNNGNSQRVPFPRPTAVGEYKKYMEGVDTSGQMLGTNSPHRKTKRWHLTVFHHLLDIAVTNSYILQKEISFTLQQKPLTRQAFQEQLCAELLGVPPAGPPRPLNQDHLPVPTRSGHDTAKRQRASQGRKQCTLCKRSTPWMCEECGVGLCLQLDRNCFRIYHS